MVLFLFVCVRGPFLADSTDFMATICACPAQPNKNNNPTQDGADLAGAALPCLLSTKKNSLFTKFGFDLGLLFYYTWAEKFETSL